MNRKRVTDLLTGALIAVLIIFTAVPSFASSFQQTISVTYDSIKIIVDGNPISPRDTNGNLVEPFIYNGTTYLPVRAVGQAFGKNVSWDGSTKTVYISQEPIVQPTGEQEPKEQYMSDILTPYHTNFNNNRVSINQEVTMGGEKYYKNYVCALLLKEKAGASFNLDGKYTTIKGTLGLLDYNNKQDIHIEFRGDGSVISEFDLKAGALPQQINVDVSGVRKLDIVAITASSSVNEDICLADPIIY